MYNVYKYNKLLPKRRRARSSLDGTLPFIRIPNDGYYCSGKNKKHHGSTIHRKVATVLIYWLFLGGTSTVTRFIAINKSPHRLEEILYFPFALGIMQDVAVITQAIAVMWCMKVLLGRSSRIPPLSAMVLCNAMPFLDILLQLRNCPRVDLGFVINLWYNFGVFYPSLKQAATSSWKFASLFTVSCAFLILGASILNYADITPKKPKGKPISHLRRNMLALGSIGYFYAIWAIRMASRTVDQSVMYCVENAIFKLQYESLEQTTGGPSNTQSISTAVDNVTSASEVYTMPELDLSDLLDRNASFPTLRNTIGYKGDKLFDIKLKKQDPNILLVMMESWKDLRALGPDARRIITPEFDKLCKTGISFDSHYTPSVQTSRTLMSNLFGNLPGTLVESAIKEHPELNLKGLPTLTKAKGYHNAFISAVDLSWDNWSSQLKRFGFDQLEDWKSINNILRDRDYPPIEREHEGNWGLWDEKAFDGLYEHMKDMKANGTKSLINFYTVSTHWPFQIPSSYVVPEEVEQFSQNDEDRRYLATLSYSDMSLGRFISRCRREGLLNNTLVFIQGDHGGPAPAHVTNGVRDEVTHIPALLLADGLIPQRQIGKSISQVSSQADIFATVADIVGIPDGGMLNHGIGSSMMRRDPDKVVYLENPFQGKTIGCRRGDIKVVQEGSAAPKVYNMTADRSEEHPISSFDAKDTDLIERTSRIVDIFSSLYGMNQFAPSET